MKFYPNDDHCPIQYLKSQNQTGNANYTSPDDVSWMVLMPGVISRGALMLLQERVQMQPEMFVLCFQVGEWHNRTSYFIFLIIVYLKYFIINWKKSILALAF